MIADGSLYRIAAFTDTPSGGNPAGVWLGCELPSTETMQRIAREVGFSETVFVSPSDGQNRSVRYFSPEAEVTFCGHATIAAGFVLGSDTGETTYQFETQAGRVPVIVRSRDGRIDVSLVSVPTRYTAVSKNVLDEALDLLNWSVHQLDVSMPPAVAYAGAFHLVLAAASKDRLDRLAYDFDGLRSLMLREDYTTVQLVWREQDRLFHSRNPFPVGGVVEDPATGAAAAAFGGYLRDSGLISVPVSFEIRQGEVMGRPSLLTVDVPESGGVMVTGTAVPMQA